MSEEQNPQAGGSYLRNPDGTLTKADELLAGHPQEDEAITAPAEQPAAPAAPTSKGAK